MSLKDDALMFSRKLEESYKKSLASQAEIIKTLKKLIETQIEFLGVTMTKLKIIKKLIVELRTDKIPDNAKKKIVKLVIETIEKTIQDIENGRTLLKEL